MRAKVLLPILGLLVVFCVGLGAAVYMNMSQSSIILMEQQLHDRIDIAYQKIQLTQQAGGLLTATQIQSILDEMSVHEGGIFIAGSDGIVIADSQLTQIGENIALQDWFTDVFSSVDVIHSIEVGSTDVVACAATIDGWLFVAYYPQEMMDTLTITPLYVIGVVGITGIVVLGFCSYLLITRFLVNPIEALDEQMEDFAKGRHIQTRPLASNSAITRIAQSLNDMLKPAAEAATETGPAAEAAPKAGPAAAPAPAPEPAPAPAEAAPETRLAAAPADAPGQNSRVVFDLTQVLREAFAQVHSQIETKAIKFSLLIANDVPLTLEADKELFDEEISSLLAAAIEAAASGTEVKAVLRLQPARLESHSDDISICFVINYNSIDKTTVLDAKKG